MTKPDVLRLHLPAGAAAFTTLRGCVDAALPYDGVSICTYTGDAPSHVADSLAALSSCTGIPSERIVSARQTHSVNVAYVSRPAAIENTDALVSDRPGIAIGVHTADCVPVVLFDPVARIIGAVHSGWRGTVGRISAAAVREMCTLGATPGQIHAAMGPCICPDCFEVGEEVAEEFIKANLGGFIIRKPGAKPHIDLPAAVAATLMESGLEKSNIALPPECNRCRPDLFFSARRLGTSSGRTFTFIHLENQ